MDALLSRVTQQAVHFAIRSGISITTGYALKQCGRLLKGAPKGREREELMQLQARLESKIRIISPSVDLIELIAARGNTTLESAVSLTKEIRFEIQTLGLRLANAATQEELHHRQHRRAKSREETDRELQAIVNQMRILLARIEDAIPLISLAITTSGVNLSTKLAGSISPSRLLQASTFLTAADRGFASDPHCWHQVGPTYVLSLYMLFAGHASRSANGDGLRDTTWKEVLHKCHLKMWRVPLDQLYSRPGERAPGQLGATIPSDSYAADFAYQLVVVEDLNDNRVHTFEGNDAAPERYDDVLSAGIRDVVPLHEISKVFYADTGKILNIDHDGDSHNPVLLLKRDVHAEPPRRMLQRSRSSQSLYGDSLLSGVHIDIDGDSHEQGEFDAQIERESLPGTPLRPSSDGESAWRLPADLDPEWMALEVYQEEEDDSESDGDDPAQSERPSSSRSTSMDTDLSNAVLQLNLRPSSTTSSPQSNPQFSPSRAPPSSLQISPSKSFGPPVKTSLSLLEMLIKLAALQQFRQESHLAIEDELLNFFLEDSATAGAGLDKERRQRLRQHAVSRVGFDPYDESPIKRRSEDYIRSHARNSTSPSPEAGPLDGTTSPSDRSVVHRNPLGDIPRLDLRRASSSSAAVPYSPRATASPPVSPRSPSTRSGPMPGRPSTPDSSSSSEQHRHAVRAKYTAYRASLASPSPASPSPRAPPMSSSPSPGVTAKARPDMARARTEPKAPSPLGQEIKHA